MAKSRSQISRRNRQRGAELERETAAFLWDELGLVFKRNLGRGSIVEYRIR